MDPAQAFEAAAGFSPESLRLFILAVIVFAFMAWGGWQVLGHYKNWATNSIKASEMVSGVIAVLVMLILISLLFKS